MIGPLLLGHTIYFLSIIAGQYIGDPIYCFTPAEFTSQWSKYKDQLCWVKNTYYVPATENIPAHEEREGNYNNCSKYLKLYKTLIYR